MAEVDSAPQKPVLLVVDDTPANLSLITLLLEEYGYEVHTASDGHKALERIGQISPDLILLDVDMPGKNGFETCQAIKADHLTKDIPVIFISAMGETEDKIKGFEAGGVDYIIKPFQIADVLARIKTHLTMRNLQQQLKEANFQLKERITSLSFSEAALKISEAREREQRLLADALRDSTAAINSTLDLDEVLDSILFNLRRVVPHDTADIMLIKGSVAEIVRCSGYDQIHEGMGEKALGLQFDISSTENLRSMIDSKQPSLIEDTRQFDWMVKEATNWVRSHLGAPILIKGRVAGFLSLSSAHAHFFTPEHATRLQIIANQAAAAIENARLFSETKRRAEELSALNRIAQAITSNLDLNQVLKTLHEQCMEVLPSDSFYVATYNEMTHLIHHPLFYDQGKYIDVAPRDIRVTPGLSGEIILSGKTLYFPDIDDPQVIKAHQIVHTTKDNWSHTYLGAPLIAHDHVVGVISIQSRSPNSFTPDQIHLLETIAAQAAIAIENAHLFEQMKQLAITDPLTGLSNRREFFSLGEKEFERARRYNRQLSIIMMDIDRFKNVNDTYGHPIGDLVLQALADTCKQHIRTIDIIGRYGGEEFAILLPEAGEETGLSAAERLRTTVEKMCVPTPSGTIQITISLGVAEVGPDTATLEALLNCADQAMYAAKQNGRNQVKVYKLTLK